MYFPFTLQQWTEPLAEGDALVEMSKNRGQIRERYGVYLTPIRGCTCHGARHDYHSIIIVRLD